MNRVNYKQVARISSAPPDEGEPDLKYNPSFNLDAAEFRPGMPLNIKPVFTQKPTNKELRATASSYEPIKPKVLSSDAPSFEFKSSAVEFVPSFFASPKLSENTPTYVPDSVSPLKEPFKDPSSVFDFVMEPIKPEASVADEQTPVKIFEFEENKAEPDIKQNEPIIEKTEELKENVKLEEPQEPLEIKEEKPVLEEPAENKESLPAILNEISEKNSRPPDMYEENYKEDEFIEEEEETKEIEEIPEVPKKRVYDFEDIKNLKCEFFKDPNFFVIPVAILDIKERVVVEITKPGRGGKRQGEDRKVREIIRVTWRKAKTAEEQKISDKAKEYTRKFTVTVAEQEAIKKKVRITLNKLSPNNLEKLSNEMLETCKKSHDYLKLVVSGIFEKAWAETKYTQMYSSICKYLKQSFEDFKYPDVDVSRLPQTKNYFKYELLYMCEETFKKNPEENDLASLPENKKQEVLAKLKKKTLGNVRFIGELFNVNLITANIILECITSLLDLFEKDINEDKLEGACVLLLTGAGSFERPKLKDETERIYKRLDDISNGFNISTKNKFKILDLQDHRRAGWKNFEKEELKKVEEIHADFHNEQNEILKRHGYNN